MSFYHHYFALANSAQWGTEEDEESEEEVEKEIEEDRGGVDVAMVDEGR